MARKALPPLIRYARPSRDPALTLWQLKAQGDTAFVCIPITNGSVKGPSPMLKALEACRQLVESGFTNDELARALLLQLQKQAKEAT